MVNDSMLLVQQHFLCEYKTSNVVNRQASNKHMKSSNIAPSDVLFRVKPRLVDDVI